MSNHSSDQSLQTFGEDSFGARKISFQIFQSFALESRFTLSLFVLQLEIRKGQPRLLTSHNLQHVVIFTNCRRSTCCGTNPTNYSRCSRWSCRWRIRYRLRVRAFDSPLSELRISTYIGGTISITWSDCTPSNAKGKVYNVVWSPENPSENANLWVPFTTYAKRTFPFFHE